MEMADTIVINKADGDNILKTTAKQSSRALHLFPAKKSGWIPTTATCSNYTRRIPEVWETIEIYRTHEKQ
jgi:LAO/AO transport system kinase